MGALGSPLCTISPSETPNLRRNQRLVLRCGLTPSMHVHIPQREHADLSSLCPNQLSLCSLKAKITTCGIVLTHRASAPRSLSPPVRRCGEGAAVGSLALLISGLFLPSGKFSAFTKPDLPRLRLPPLPPFQISAFCGRCSVRLMC